MITISTDFIAGVLLGYFLYRSLNGLWKERRQEIEEECQRAMKEEIRRYIARRRRSAASQTKQGL